MNNKDFSAVGVTQPITDAGITVAIVSLDKNNSCSIHWLPDLFKLPLPASVRAAIVEHLRFHAKKLETGELEARMARFAYLNDDKKHD